MPQSILRIEAETNGGHLPNDIFKYIFLHDKPWVPGGEKSIFTAIIDKLRSHLLQIGRARTIDEHDVTMPVPEVRITSKINSGDVKMLRQKRPSLATMAKSVIDDCV